MGCSIGGHIIAALVVYLFSNFKARALLDILEQCAQTSISQVEYNTIIIIYTR
jgi:hypothetical protein